MKKYIIAGTAVAVAFAFSYAFLIDRDVTGSAQSLPAAAVSTSAIEQKIDELTNTVQYQLQRYHDQIEQTRLEQSRLNDAIASLEARIQSAEVIQSQQLGQLDEITYTTPETDRELTENEPADSNPDKINEGEMGRWMDDVLSSGYLDDVASTLASEQVSTSLIDQPGVQLADMLCNQRFCRASFTREDGQRPDIGKMLGVPPFVNEGFSVDEPDGSVTVYFTDSGVSLSELQNEASQELVIYN